MRNIHPERFNPDVPATAIAQQPSLSHSSPGNVPLLLSGSPNIEPMLLPETASSELLTEPPRPNAVPVINSAPPASVTAAATSSVTVLQPLTVEVGYTARNLHPETSPHLFIASKNV